MILIFWYIGFRNCLASLGLWKERLCITTRAVGRSVRARLCSNDALMLSAHSSSTTECRSTVRMSLSHLYAALKAWMNPSVSKHTPGLGVLLLSIIKGLPRIFGVSVNCSVKLFLWSRMKAFVAGKVGKVSRKKSLSFISLQSPVDRFRRIL